MMALPEKKDFFGVENGRTGRHYNIIRGQPIIGSGFFFFDTMCKRNV